MAVMVFPRCKQCGGDLIVTNVFRCGSCGLPAPDVTAEGVRAAWADSQERERQAADLAPVMQEIVFQPSEEDRLAAVKLGTEFEIDLTPVEDEPLIPRRK